jgi:hypothetical protein
MFNLYEILRNAHGGHALDNLGGGRSPMGPGRPPSAAPGQAGGGQGGLGGILASILRTLTSRPGAAPGTGPPAGPRPQRKPASAGFRCGFDPGGSRSPHQNTAAGNARGINPEIDQIMGGKRP